MLQRPINVLLVEPDTERLARTREALGSARPNTVHVQVVERLSETLARLTEGGIDIVLLDLDLPDSHGVATVERLNAFAPDVPVVVLADEADEEVAQRTVQGGAQEYLVREEIQPALLHRAIRHAIERHRLLSALRSLSLIDELTGLYNQRGFGELGDQYLKLARRSSRTVALLCFDIDRFKTINDTLGHHVGDRALVQMADILRAAFRRSDIVARIGGDEFAVLALQGTEEDPDSLEERFRERLAEFNRAHSGRYRLAASMGSARQDAGEKVRLEELLSRADQRLHEEKRAKRAMVQVEG